MSDRDWSDLLDGGWPAAAPAPGFADRVLVRVAAPELRIVPMPPISSIPPPSRAWRKSFVFAAVAVAALVIFPLALHRQVPPAHAANTVAVGVVPDLGLERD
jgi:hypothetical protein